MVTEADAFTNAGARVELRHRRSSVLVRVTTLGTTDLDGNARRSRFIVVIESDNRRNRLGSLEMSKLCIEHLCLFKSSCRCLVRLSTSGLAPWIDGPLDRQERSRRGQLKLDGVGFRGNLGECKTLQIRLGLIRCIDRVGTTPARGMLLFSNEANQRCVPGGQREFFAKRAIVSVTELEPIAQTSEFQ